jgi:hypothetical protein
VLESNGTGNVQFKVLEIHVRPFQCQQLTHSQAGENVQEHGRLAWLLEMLRIPVKWAPDSGDVGRRRSEATLVAFYSSEVAHMSQEKGK